MTYYGLWYYTLSMSTLERFWAKVARSGKCWTWTGAKNTGGYGVFSVEGRQVQAHRFIFEETYGSIPDRAHVHHSCETRACVRPEHLEALTPRRHAAEHSHTGIPPVITLSAYGWKIGMMSRKDREAFFANLEGVK